MSVVGRISKEQQMQLDRISKDAKNTERLNKQKLDKDAFFRLMLEQLKHQDPTAPMDNSAMLAQMSQFSTMEQLGNMVKMQENMTKATEGVSTQLKALAEKLGGNKENAEILTELRKMNKLLETYIPGLQKKENATTILTEHDSKKEQSDGGTVATGKEG